MKASTRSSPQSSLRSLLAVSFVLAIIAFFLALYKMHIQSFWKWTTTAVLLLATTAPLPTSAALNITISQPNVPFAPSPLPASHAASDGSAIITAFQNLGRTTTWTLVEKVHFEGDTYEPEGMVRLGPDRYIVSAGEYTAPTVSYNATINGTDRSAGAGFAHLIVFSGNGTRIADATLTAPGAIEYHNGGIDFDGQYIWATIAQYRPNSTATVMRIDPSTLEPTPILHYPDHLGGIVHNTQTNVLTTLNWGARNASLFNLSSSSSSITPNPSSSVPTLPAFSIARNPTFFTDYQDCKFLSPSPSTFSPSPSPPLMLCAGIASLTNPANASAPSYNLGSLSLVDTTSMLPVGEIPVTLTSELGVNLAENPVDVSVNEETGALRVYFLPDQRESTLYVYEADLGGGYEF